MKKLLLLCCLLSLFKLESFAVADTIRFEARLFWTYFECDEILENNVDNNPISTFCDGSFSQGDWKIDGPGGCVSYLSNSLGIDSACVETVDQDGDRDTTIFIVEKVYWSTHDTIRIDENCMGEANFCLDGELDLFSPTYHFCDGSISGIGNFGKYSLDTVGCVTYIPFGINGTEELCVVTCSDELMVCDSTIMIFTTFPCTDTIRDTTLTNNTSITCVLLEDGFDPSTTVYSFCDGTILGTGYLGTYSIEEDGCLTYNSSIAVGVEAPICVVACDAELGICDTTIFYLTVGAIDSNTILNFKTVIDSDKDCQGDTTLLNAGTNFLSVRKNNSSQKYTIHITNSTYFSFDTGTYIITPIISNQDFEYLCDSFVVNIDATIDTIFDSIHVAPKPIIERLQVEIHSDRIRYCNAPINYTVKYSNHSSKPISNAFIDIVLDDQLRFSQSIFPNYTLTDSTHVRFQIGTLSPYQSDQLTFNANLPCGVSTPGETHCTEAHIYPDTLTQRLYFGPEIVVEGSCEGDSVAFRVTNNGNPMTQPAIYLVFEDDLMIKRTTYQLASGASFTERFIANGHTYRMEAHLYANPPQVYGDSISAAWVEGCDNTGGTVSKGYILMYDLDEEVDYIAKDCHQSVTSWDPNEKIGTPEGYHEQHYIRKNQAIEYGINFENLGNDTAYIVVIVDTLSQALDTNTFSMLLSSHPCFYTLKNYVLTVTFPNINLLWTNNYPDSSKGFFLYQIQPKDDIALSSKIENTAYIYFDNNSPVQTNTTLHTIGEKFVRVLSVYNQQGKRLEARVYPNPANKWVNIEIMDLPINDKVSISIFSIDGKKLSVINTVPEGKFTVDISNLADGMYFFTMQNDSEQLLSGKFVIER